MWLFSASENTRLSCYKYYIVTTISVNVNMGKKEFLRQSKTWCLVHQEQMAVKQEPHPEKLMNPRQDPPAESRGAVPPGGDAVKWLVLSGHLQG